MNLDFYSQEVNDLLIAMNKVANPTTLATTDTIAALSDGVYTATAAVASAISDSPTTSAFILRVLSDVHILFVSDGSVVYIGASGVWSQYATKDALAEVIDSGAKNVFEFTEIGKNADHSTTSYTSNGVVYTLNADYSVTVERTATSTVDSSCNFRVSTGSAVIDDYCNGNYVLSGCPSGGGSDAYEMTALSVAEGADYRYSDTGNGVLLPDKGTNTNIFARMLVSKSFTGTITFKPMICSKAAWAISQAYAPYRPSYQELYERIVALEQASGTRSLKKKMPSTDLEEKEESR